MRKTLRPALGDTVTVLPMPDLAGTGVKVIRAEGVWALVGTCCQNCGDLVFPPVAGCLECGSEKCEPVPVANEGILYAFTTIHVSASRPTPYAIGYVDLDDGIRVLTPLEHTNTWTCGQTVHLVVSEDGQYKCEPSATSKRVVL